MLFLFFFRIVFNYFFAIPVEIENARLKIALAILTGTPITVANDAIEMLPLVADKTIKDLSKYPKEAAICLLNLWLLNSLFLISVTK